MTRLPRETDESGEEVVVYEGGYDGGVDQSSPYYDTSEGESVGYVVDDTTAENTINDNINDVEVEIVRETGGEDQTASSSVPATSTVLVIAIKGPNGIPFFSRIPSGRLATTDDEWIVQTPFNTFLKLKKKEDGKFVYTNSSLESYVTQFEGVDEAVPTAEPETTPVPTYTPTVTASPTTFPPSAGDDDDDDDFPAPPPFWTKKNIAIVIGAVIGASSLLALVFYFLKKRKAQAMRSQRMNGFGGRDNFDRDVDIN